MFKKEKWKRKEEKRNEKNIGWEQKNKEIGNMRNPKNCNISPKNMTIEGNRKCNGGKYQRNPPKAVSLPALDKARHTSHFTLHTSQFTLHNLHFTVCITPFISLKWSQLLSETAPFTFDSCKKYK